LDLNEFKPFYHLPEDDDNFYHITCKMVLQSHPQTCDDDYDFEFFSQNHYVKCKLLSHCLVVNILNKEIYGVDFDANDLKHKYPLTMQQKFNLDLNLKQILFPRDQILTYHHSREFRIASNSETSTSQRNMNMNSSINQVLTQIQPIQTYQSLQLNEFR